MIYGIALNTTDYGTNPTGVAGGYDSLNVALSNGPPSPGIGSDPVANSIYWDTQTGQILRWRHGRFRHIPPGPGMLGPEWDERIPSPYYVPAVKFTAVANLQPAITSANAATAHKGVPFNFTVTTTGSPIPAITLLGTLPGGIDLPHGQRGRTMRRRSGGIPTYPVLHSACVTGRVARGPADPLPAARRRRDCDPSKGYQRMRKPQ